MSFTMQLLLLSISICSLARNLLPPWFVVGRPRVPLCTVLLLLGTRNTKAFHSQVCLSHLRYQESAVGQSTRHALSQKLLPPPHSSLTTSAEEQLIECLRNRLVLQDQHPQHVMTVPAYFTHRPQPTVKERRPRQMGCWNINPLPCSLALLKKVPNCKFRRFQYFCCSYGTVKLISHQLPPALKSMYFGVTNESNHFRTYIQYYVCLYFTWSKI